MQQHQQALSPELTRALNGFTLEQAEQVFLQSYLKNTQVFLVKTNVAKQSVTELSRQISVMISLASARYEFTLQPSDVFGPKSELSYAFSSMQHRSRIGDLFIEWLTDRSSGRVWNQRAIQTMLQSSQHSALNVNIWDPRIFIEPKLAIACLNACYFEFSLATLREFDVSKTAYKRSRPLRELHLSICQELKHFCSTLPLQELSGLMHFPLERAILAQQTPDNELLSVLP